MFLIKLANPEQPLEFMPPVTHARVVNVTYEADRAIESKPGYVEVWLAKGFIINGRFREAPGVPGINLTLPLDSDGAQHFGLLEFESVVAKMLINLGKIEGDLGESK